jgi:hypothetical protein
MIGKYEWFARRKYTGWGIVPRTWQGWLYIVLAIIPFAALQLIPNISNKTRIIGTGIWAILVIIDTLDIMFRMKRDEREKAHEAIAERNALWVMIIALAIGVAYEAAASVAQKRFAVDPVIMAALFAGLLTKGITNYYLDKKE